MSDQPEVTPLRLKRPGAAGAPAPATPPATPSSPTIPPTPEAGVGSPLMPLPGQAPASPTIPPTPPAPADAPPPERLRRRPSLASENSAAPAPPSASFPPIPGAVAPQAGGGASPESPVIPLPFVSSVPTQPPMPHPPSADAAGPGTPPPPAATGGGFKLKIGAKAPPPPMIPSGDMAPPMNPSGVNTVGGAPLIPLPGMPAVGGGAGFPPPAVADSAAPLSPLPPLPPIPQVPVMTAGVPGSATSGGTRPPIHLRSDAPVEALDPSKLPPPLPAARARAAVAGAGSARRDAMVFAIAFLVIAGVGGGAWFYFTRPGDTAEAIGEVREKLEEAAKLPGKAVDNAKETIAGAREKEQARVDAVAEGQEVPDERVVGAVSPGELQTKLQEANTSPDATPPATTPPPEVQSVTAYAGEKPTEPVAPPPVPAATPRFVRYAEALRVSGVFQGSPARALVDGRLVRSGDLIEPNLGVTFVGVDAGSKHLILQDGTGAQVRVKY